MEIENFPTQYFLGQIIFGWAGLGNFCLGLGGHIEWLDTQCSPLGSMFYLIIVHGISLVHYRHNLGKAYKNLK